MASVGVAINIHDLNALMNGLAQRLIVSYLAHAFYLHNGLYFAVLVKETEEQPVQIHTHILVTLCRPYYTSATMKCAVAGSDLMLC